MFIQTEETPNPATLKFIPGRPIVMHGTADFPNKESAQQTPLAQKLFNHPAVKSIFLGNDFISVTKKDEMDWLTIKPSLLTSIMEFFLNNSSVDVTQNTQKTSHKSSLENAEIEKEIQELLETRIRPAVAQDGGDIIFDHFDDGIVYVQLQGACSGCPSSTATLKSGIENMLRHYIPEVVEVRSL